ncbi:MAG: hypothetical protein ACC682_11180 [Gemmatimonadota bacterium]
MKRVMSFVAVGFGLLLGASPAEAQWQFQVTPYIWWNGLSGDVRVEGGPVVSLESEVSDFDVAPLLTFRGSNGRIGFLTDLAFTSGSSTARALNEVRLVEVDNFIGTGLVTYDVTSAGNSEVFVAGGLRILNAKAKVPALNGGVESEASRTWVDPVFGLGGSFGDRVTVTGYGDLGGFGISSDFTYQLYGALGYRFTGATSAQLGYRLVSNDYMDGNQYLYNVRQGGFLLGVTFGF